MSRQKLHGLAIDLPLLPTTAVGSFPKPDFLVTARSQFARRDISHRELDDIAREATIFWLETQEEIGLDILVDGEMYRGDMVAYFAENMPGFTRGGLVRSYGNRYYHKPVITGEVRWPRPVTVEWWKFAQSHTSKPVKGMLTGPYTIMDWSFIEYYPDRKSACLALAKEIRREVEALIEAGAKIIQIDEPALSVRPEELPLATEAMQIVTEGLPAYFINHACYGAFEAIYPGMLALPVDNLDLAISNSAMDYLSVFRRNPFTKDLSVGVVDVHSHMVELPGLLRDRIWQALDLVPKEALWISPDCGLKTRTVEEAKEKLKRMVEAARTIRQSFQSA